MFTTQCGRPTTKGTPCQARICTAVRPACERHLTDEERAEQSKKAEAELHRRAALLRYFPACWEWDPIETDDGGAFEEWHAGCCAICGRGGELVTDHCHQTGLVRGLLCRSCNTREGTNHVFVLYDRYRWRHPAAITGYVERYWHPIYGEDFGHR